MNNRKINARSINYDFPNDVYLEFHPQSAEAYVYTTSSDIFEIEDFIKLKAKKSCIDKFFIFSHRQASFEEKKDPITTIKITPRKSNDPNFENNLHRLFRNIDES